MSQTQKHTHDDEEEDQLNLLQLIRVYSDREVIKSADQTADAGVRVAVFGCQTLKHPK